jgi:hypothetical protein
METALSNNLPIQFLDELEALNKQVPAILENPKLIQQELSTPTKFYSKIVSFFKAPTKTRNDFFNMASLLTKYCDQKLDYISDFTHRIQKEKEKNSDNVTETTANMEKIVELSGVKLINEPQQPSRQTKDNKTGKIDIYYGIGVIVDSLISDLFFGGSHQLNEFKKCFYYSNYRIFANTPNVLFRDEVISTVVAVYNRIEPKIKAIYSHNKLIETHDWKPLLNDIIYSVFRYKIGVKKDIPIKNIRVIFKSDIIENIHENPDLVEPPLEETVNTTGDITQGIEEMITNVADVFYDNIFRRSPRSLNDYREYISKYKKFYTLIKSDDVAFIRSQIIEFVEDTYHQKIKQRGLYIYIENKEIKNTSKEEKIFYEIIYQILKAKIHDTGYVWDKSIQIYKEVPEITCEEFFKLKEKEYAHEQQNAPDEPVFEQIIEKLESKDSKYLHLYQENYANLQSFEKYKEFLDELESRLTEVNGIIKKIKTNTQERIDKYHIEEKLFQSTYQLSQESDKLLEKGIELSEKYTHLDRESMMLSKINEEYKLQLFEIVSNTDGWIQETKQIVNI